MEYEYEVFISYRRLEPPEMWVEYFANELEYQLAWTLGKDKVFYDKKNAKCRSWNDHVIEKIGKSKLLISIFTYDYFDDNAFALKEMAYMYHRFIKFKGDYKDNVCPILPICLGNPKFFVPYSEMTINSDFYESTPPKEPKYFNKKYKDKINLKIKDLRETIFDILKFLPDWKKEYSDKKNFDFFEQHIPHLRKIRNVNDSIDFGNPNQV